jgi:HSP20 family protein
MQLVRFNPTRNIVNFRSPMNHFFDDFFGDQFKGEDADLTRVWNPKVDIFEEEDHIVMVAELPGVEKDKIAIDVTGRVLTVKGERSSDNEIKEDNFYRRERSYGKFKRSFTLPDETNSEKIKAAYKDGVLTLNIPKPASSKTKQITVQ